MKSGLVQSRISVARNEVQFREGEAPAEPCVSAVQWLGGSLALRFHHNFVDSLTVRENFSVKFILMRKSVRVFVGELGCR